MKIIVDTNIVFSAILSSSGKIGQLLFYGRNQFDFYTPNLLKTEIKKHQVKIMGLGELILEDFEATRDDIFTCINFVTEDQIPYDYWYEAIPFVRDTDMDDIAFVVLSEYLNAKLWTGDKELISGLKNMGFVNVITTDELYQILKDYEN